MGNESLLPVLIVDPHPLYMALATTMARAQQSSSLFIIRITDHLE